MKLTLTLAAATLSLAAFTLPRAQNVSVGQEAPEFGTSGAQWFNHLGQDPDLAALRGKAVLIEFWATW